MQSHLTQDSKDGFHSDNDSEYSEVCFINPQLNRTEKGSDIWNYTMEAFDVIVTDIAENEFKELILNFTNRYKLYNAKGKRGTLQFMVVNCQIFRRWGRGKKCL